MADSDPRFCLTSIVPVVRTATGLALANRAKQGVYRSLGAVLPVQRAHSLAVDDMIPSGRVNIVYLKSRI